MQTVIIKKLKSTPMSHPLTSRTGLLPLRLRDQVWSAPGLRRGLEADTM